VDVEDYHKLKSKEKSHIPEYRGIEYGIQNNNMPGISLRTWKNSNNSFGHYRPVIAFEKHGYIFSMVK
jgi:hypothetical protein